MFSDKHIVEKVGQYIKKFTGWEPTISVNLSDQSTAGVVAILALQKEMTKIISGKWVKGSGLRAENI